MSDGSATKMYVSSVKIDLKRRGCDTSSSAAESLVMNGSAGRVGVPKGSAQEVTGTEFSSGVPGKAPSAQPSVPSFLQNESVPPNIPSVHKAAQQLVSPAQTTDLPLRFEKTPEPVEVRVGERVQLDCTFSSSFPVACCWIHNKQQVANGAQIKVESSNQGSKLLIAEARLDDAGCHTVIVKNHRASIQHKVFVSIIGCPHPPVSPPVISQLSSNSLVLSWSGPSYDGGAVVVGYVVELKTAGPGEPGDWIKLTDCCTSTSYRVQMGLEHGKEYRFRVSAYNKAGVSEPSQESDTIKMEDMEETQEESPSYVNVAIDTTHKVSDHYNVLERLGVGKFGQVFRLSRKETGRLCAGKFYKARLAKEKVAARKEIELMSSLHHPKLVQCLGAYDSKAELVMVMEFIAGGELFERIVNDSFEHTEPTCVQYVLQILEGISYMHKLSIVHLDLKPENIVCIDSTGTRIKIIDFGLASRLDPKTPLKVMHGTPEFVAPEVINYEPVGLATDMWSIGVISYILLSGESPFQGENDAETLALVTRAQWEFDEESFEEITEQAKDFISALLKKDIKRRLSSEQALAHPWMASFVSADPSTIKSLSKDKMKRFLARQKWKKMGKAFQALKRLAIHSSKADGSDSPANPQKDTTPALETELALLSLEEQLLQEPQFTQALEDLTQPLGSSVHLSCCLNGYPEPTVQWLLDGKPVAESSRVEVEQSQEGCFSLHLSSVTSQDVGVYTCRASNTLGVAMCSARLTVEE